MKKYLAVLVLLLSGVVLVFVGFSYIEGSAQPAMTAEAWCESMMVKPNAEWLEAEARRFAQDCLNP